MFVKQLFSNNEIVSESSLHKITLEQLKKCLKDTATNEVKIIEPFDIQKIINTWRASIDKQNSALVRSSLSALVDLPHGCLYERLNEPDWKRAAQICEVFRDTNISKNSGSLDTKNIQKHIHSCLDSDGALNLVIAWGQPKRIAGGLKTLGSFADLAEMYSIGKLVVIVNAVSKLAGKQVKLTVMTGGRRFYPALFSRQETNLVYDRQRQEIANALASDGIIKFTFYPVLNTENFELTDTQQNILQHITDEMILTKFSTVLLNIDWNHLLDPIFQRRHHDPHDIQLPINVVKWLEAQKTNSVTNLIRASIVSLIFPQYQAECFRDFNNNTVLESAISFIQKVAWESTRKYIAIHLADTVDKTDKAPHSQSANILRLTVHEKKEKRHIPAIFTLGLRNGNQLSQHVMASISQSGEAYFGSYAELCSEDVTLVKLDKKGNYPLFNWLSESDQPLCLVNTNITNSVDLICHTFK